MPATVIVGLQWGDEGKGKTTDALAEHVTAVVRYQGGDNAGHTIMLGEEVFKLHLVPSGVLYPHIAPIIGNGVVVNPATLITELAKAAVGTTRRGIGPAYADRAWRIGIRMEDLLDGPALRGKLARILPEKNATLQRQHRVEGFDLDELVELATGWGRRLKPHLADTTQLVQELLAKGDHILFEGAQGALLDLDHGSYPFVTSSNPIAGGACTGGGIGPLQVDEVLGVMKAYATRVGAGPFPTELEDEIGEGIIDRGREFGTTTGRRRRVGWFDAVPLRYAVAVNSVSSIMLNKIDILSGLDEVLICMAYEVDGERVEWWPSDADILARAKPIYERFPGWKEPIHDCRSMAELPENARRYVDAVERLSGAPICFVSVGPERHQTIERSPRPQRPKPLPATLPADR